MPGGMGSLVRGCLKGGGAMGSSEARWQLWWFG